MYVALVVTCPLCLVHHILLDSLTLLLLGEEYKLWS